MKRISKIALIVTCLLFFSWLLGYGISYFFPMASYEYYDLVNITCLGCHDITIDDYTIPTLMLIIIPVIVIVLSLRNLVPDKKPDQTP